MLLYYSTVKKVFFHKQSISHIKIKAFTSVFSGCIRNPLRCDQRCIDGLPGRCACFPGYEVNPSNSSDCIGRLIYI